MMAKHANGRLFLELFSQLTVICQEPIWRDWVPFEERAFKMDYF
jgi:hypothetical protein